MKILAFLVFLAPLFAHAGVSPAADSIRRYRAVMDSQDLLKAIEPYNVVTSIKLQQDGTYLVSAEECSVVVKVEPIAPESAQGATSYKTTLVDVFCYPG